jgi:uncharacterized iron-regulated membrane protein
MLTTKRSTTTKTQKSTFRKVSEWLHLWLGLFSGIVVFIVCLTGGIWVWRYEVWRYTEKYQRVEPQEKVFLLPSQLINKAKAYAFNHDHREAEITGVTYGKPFKAATVTYMLSAKERHLMYINPYTGEILKDKTEPTAAEKFFIFIRAGHRFLWLPQKLGSPIVGSACIIFVITLITGLIWWFPRKWTRKTREKNFTVKWTANWKRLNIDIHNVIGFYAYLFIMALTITGIAFTFDWFEKGMYKALTSKTHKEVTQAEPTSDTVTAVSYKIIKPEDVIWRKIFAKYAKDYGRISLEVPTKKKEPYEVMVQFGDGTLIYNYAIHYYDQKTLKELKYTNDRVAPYAPLSVGEKIFRMNFDIHTGQILGLPTKIIAFFTCLIGASLPITGFIIWYNRKWGKKKKKKKTLQLA